MACSCLIAALAWQAAQAQSADSVAAFEQALLQEAAEPALEAALEANQEAGRALAEELLPTPEELGPGWRQPWQLPPGWWDRVSSEEAYWQQLDVVAGLDDRTAPTFVDGMAEAFLGLADAGDLVVLDQPQATIDTALRFVIGMLRERRLPPSQELLEWLENNALMQASLDASTGGQPAAGFAPGENGLRRMALAEAVRVRHQASMTYTWSNDWEGRLDFDAQRGMAVELDVIVFDPSPLRWPPDLAAADLPPLEAALGAHIATAAAAAADLTAAMRANLEAIVETEIMPRLRAAEADIAERQAAMARQPSLAAHFRGQIESAEKRRDEIARELATIQASIASYSRASATPRIEVAQPPLGDYAETVRILDTDDAAAHLPDARGWGWLRNGRAVSRIAVTPVGSDDASWLRVLDSLMTLMHAKTVPYGG